MTYSQDNAEFSHHPYAPKPSILATIGATPMVRLNHVGPTHVDLYAKLEAFNPMGSIKDRMALAMIERAERSGELQPGQTVIESTSGNTGLGLAIVCAQKGYPLVIVMGENFSLERRRLLRFLGAKVVLTSAADRGTGMFRLAEALAEKHGWFLCRQFENEVNAEIHAETTAWEILKAFPTRSPDFWVTGFGTGGTLKGVARTLRLASPTTRIVVAEPENAQLLASGVQQLRKPDGAAARSHPNARAHPIQGWTPDFIPKLAGDALSESLIDELRPVSGAEALEMTQTLAKREGVFCGISGGASVAAAVTVAKNAPKGSSIVAMVPDTGERYLSTPLFDHIKDDMSEEEERIATSVKLPKLKSANGGTAKKPISKAAAQFVEAAVNDPEYPIVMFGFEWCEFCWSVRRVFDDAGLPFRSIDVDSKDYRDDDWGGDVLRALFDMTGMRTVPQVFVSGKLMGGATEVLARLQTGGLQAHLPAHLSAVRISDPQSYLPKWVKRATPEKTNAV
ncbi:pyridoxal-phosphate dependent enzyme [Ruegeria sp. ANG-S4]|uniref:pyridoxal-phosphate dependent enzyme n=1 Tax=Ruegeria sp. ANG-S4 TaxID=1577904 RepID=UPI000690491A